MLAGDLNESHIGQRFIFEGYPRVTATISDRWVLYESPEYIKISLEDADEHNRNMWYGGYDILKKDTVIPLDIPVVDPVRQKLVEYIQTRYSDRTTGEYLPPKQSGIMADIFMELMEGGTDANGEG